MGKIINPRFTFPGSEVNSMGVKQETGRVSRRSFTTGLAALAAAGIIPRSVQGANDRLGIGVIGCGGRGSDHLNTLNQVQEAGENLAVTAVCDVYRPRLIKAADKTGAKPYMHHQELLADPEVDAVLIATPDHWHGYQLLDACEAGKDAYCEKPLTHWRQVDLTRKVVQAVSVSKRVVQTGTQTLSSSAWTQAARMIQEGAIGQPIHAQAGYFRIGDWGERMPVDDPGAKPGSDLLWDTFLGDAPKRDFSVSRFFQWRMYWDYAGGPSTDLFPHTFAPVLRMLNVSFPATVCASGGKFRYDGEREVPDTFNLLLDFPEGLSVALLCTLGNDYPVPLVVRGEEGTLTFEGDNILVKPQPGVDRPPKVDPVQRKESMVDFWRNFLACCRTREAPWSPVELAYPVQTALQMGVFALREQKVVRFSRDSGTILL